MYKHNSPIDEMLFSALSHTIYIRSMTIARISGVEMFSVVISLS